MSTPGIAEDIRLIAMKAKRNSMSMKAIAAVTMTFLPVRLLHSIFLGLPEMLNSTYRTRILSNSRNSRSVTAPACTLGADHGMQKRYISRTWYATQCLSWSMRDDR